MTQDRILTVYEILTKLWYKSYELYKAHAESDLGDVILEKILIPIQNVFLELALK